MLSINTNISSLIVQTNLKQSTNALNKAIERMTTGFKINHAKDNAANYGINTQMSTKISAYEVAEENVSMGLDMLTTASDSLSLISEHLTRIRDLTTQAQNGTYGEESMKAINSEVNARLDEIERLYSTTEFNGLKLFGESEKAGFINEVTKRDTSAMTTLASVDENTTISSGTYSISTAEELAKLATMSNNGKIGRGAEFVLANDIDLSAYSTGEGWVPIGNVYAFSADFDGNGYVVKNLYINGSNEYQGLFSDFQGSIKNIGLDNVNVNGGGYTLIGGLVGCLLGTITNCYATGNVMGDDFVGGLVGGAMGGSITDSYVTGSVTGDRCVGGLIGGSSCTITNCYAISSVTGNTNVGGFLGSDFGSTLTDCYYDQEKSGQSDTGKGVGLSTAEIQEKMKAAGMLNAPAGSGSTGSNSNPIAFQVGIYSNTESQISIDMAFALTNLSNLRNIAVSGDNYLETIDNILVSISAKQTEYGSAQNRLMSALEEINTHYENLVSSRSTLRDADVAQESSAYIRNQILQQASATLLATANQTPAIALQLL